MNYTVINYPHNMLQLLLHSAVKQWLLIYTVLVGGISWQISVYKTKNTKRSEGEALWRNDEFGLLYMTENHPAALW